MTENSNPYLTVEGTRERLTYQSWGEFVEHGKTRFSYFTDPHSQDESRGYWVGTETYQEATGLAERGWHEGTEKIKALSQVLMDKVTSLVERQTIEFDVTGADFDMASYLTGAPEHWYTIQTHIEAGRGTRAVRMVFNCAASCGISPEVIMAKGAAVAALIECLEFSGIRVQLTLIQAVKAGGFRGGSNYRMDISVPLKEAEQPLDMDRLAFALAHPSTLRRLMFAAEESSQAFYSNCGSTYGTPDNVQPDQQGDITIEKSFLDEPQWTDESSAVAWVIKTLSEQGVQVEIPS